MDRVPELLDNWQKPCEGEHQAHTQFANGCLNEHGRDERGLDKFLRSVMRVEGGIYV